MQVDEMTPDEQDGLQMQAVHALYAYLRPRLGVDEDILFNALKEFFIRES